VGVLDELRHPVVQAPMAGGPSTLALAQAVSDAGGLGFVAAGYRDAEALRADLYELRGRLFGVNLFVPSPRDVADPGAVEEYVRSLGPGAGSPRWDDDGWRAKLDVLRDEEPVPVVSFAFGCPPLCEVRSLVAHGSEVWVTVTSVDEARAAADAGASALVLQGIEAGGHRGVWVDADAPPDERLPVLPLLRLVSAAGLGLPLVAAGGVMDAGGVAAVLDAGASAAQAGTAFMLAPEAGTHPAHRAALTDAVAVTGLTRAFTGRLARGIVNRFMDEHSAGAPIAYPHIHHATAPLRAAAREAGDAGGFNLWAGQGFPLAVERPAAETVRALAGGAGAGG
jgi:nitronate monooxygenase